MRITAPAALRKTADALFSARCTGFWAGFLPEITGLRLYRFYVVGTAARVYKRDPYARELELNGYPDCNCIVRDAGDSQWHERRIPSACL